MNIPGEKLVIKMWETLADKGIGSLLQPWQERRIGKARIEVKTREIIETAKAERKATSILENSTLPSSTRKIDPFISNIVESVDRISSQDAIRKEINVSETLLRAEEILSAERISPPDAEPDEDWLHIWKESAERISNEDIQLLWAKVLAGEFTSPGRFSYRLLEFMRGLSQSEAQAISLVAGFIIEGKIFKDSKSILEANGISLGQLLRLQELGLLSAVEAIGMSFEWPSVESNSFVRVLRCNGKIIVARHKDPSRKIKVPVYILTTVGTQLLGIGNFEPNIEYIKDVASHISAQDFEVTIGDYQDLGDGRVEITNERKA